MNIPTAKKINKAHYDRLVGQQDKMVSVQHMMQSFQQNCEARLTALNVETRRIWEDIKADNPDLDLENVNWVPGPNNTIIPVQMRLTDAGQG